MRKKAVIAAVGVVLAFLMAFGQYVHRGYVGVTESHGTLRPVGHGFHLRLPWKKVTYYPARCHDIHLKTSHEGPEERIEFDIVLALSVCPDSVVSLHRKYHGAYADRLISPLVIEALRQHGSASGTWHEDSQSGNLSETIVDRLNFAVGEHGITVYRAWLVSYDVGGAPKDLQ